MIKGTPEEIRAYKLQNYHKNKDKNKEEKLLKKKLYKQANKEHIREVSKARYLRHKEAGTSYYDRNKEIIKKKVKLYRLKNIQKVKESDAKKQKRRPISSAKTEEEAIKLCHYTNFQPLCSYTNRYIKSDN